MLDRKRLLDWLNDEIESCKIQEEYFKGNERFEAAIKRRGISIAYKALVQMILDGEFDNTGAKHSAMKQNYTLLQRIFCVWLKWHKRDPGRTWQHEGVTYSPCMRCGVVVSFSYTTNTRHS